MHPAEVWQNFNKILQIYHLATTNVVLIFSLTHMYKIRALSVKPARRAPPEEGFILMAIQQFPKNWRAIERNEKQGFGEKAEEIAKSGGGGNK